MELERRQRRSEFRDLALRYWFAAMAQRHQLLGLVLADSAGLLVASSLPRQVAEEIAAQAPFWDGQSELLNALTGNDQYPIIVREIEIDGEALFLCAVGQPLLQQQQVALLQDGVSRILVEQAA